MTSRYSSIQPESEKHTLKNITDQNEPKMLCY